MSAISKLFAAVAKSSGSSTKVSLSPDVKKAVTAVTSLVRTAVADAKAKGLAYIWLHDLMKNILELNVDGWTVMPNDGAIGLEGTPVIDKTRKVLGVHTILKQADDLHLVNVGLWPSTRDANRLVRTDMVMITDSESVAADEQLEYDRLIELHRARNRSVNTAHAFGRK